MFALCNLILCRWRFKCDQTQGYLACSAAVYHFVVDWSPFENLFWWTRPGCQEVPPSLYLLLPSKSCLSPLAALSAGLHNRSETEPWKQEVPLTELACNDSARALPFLSVPPFIQKPLAVMPFSRAADQNLKHKPTNPVNWLKWSVPARVTVAPLVFICSFSINAVSLLLCQGRQQESASYRSVETTINQSAS